MGLQEYTYKILIIGEPFVGKTSVARRYTKNSFSDVYKVTIGVDFSLKVLQWSKNETVKLQLWDIAGQERSVSLARTYYTAASACVIVFDVTNEKTFKNSFLWKQELDDKVILSDGRPVPCILFANKCDLSPWAVSKEELNEFSRENGFIGWVETSAKENKNITEAMRMLVENIMEKSDVMPPVNCHGDHLNLKNEPPRSRRSSECC